jgi:hypothetical protein
MVLEFFDSPFLLVQCGVMPVVFPSQLHAVQVEGGREVLRLKRARY